VISGQEGDGSPHGEHDSHHDQEDHPSGSVPGTFHSFGRLSLTVLPPGQSVTDDQGQTDCQDHLRQQILEVEYVGDGKDRNGG
jgi:hypothetical protein